MAKDFQQKEPSKMEKVVYQLAMDQESLRHNLWTTSAFATALAMINKIEPEEVAKLLTTDNAKIQEFSKKINEAIDKIEKEKKAKDGEQKEEHHHTNNEDHQR